MTIENITYGIVVEFNPQAEVSKEYLQEIAERFEQVLANEYNEHVGSEQVVVDIIHPDEV